MRIDVTQEDIDRGTPDNCLYCPVARALNRVLPNEVFAVRKAEIIRALDEDGETQVIAPPQEVIDFVAAFDSCEPVAPFSFELDLDAA